jgi:prepilin-type N-terminal cleavage/methylation domain-containing protein/prepilin-type processing-associated H-X9-DG protein
MRRPRGFTLIELLVVIAIIAILAAMLFPVFARARESARKIQCLANVKNIATAVQMYLVDYDRFPPDEHRPEVNEWFNEYGGKDCCCRGTEQNPYLRWPVILDEYTKNRDVWRCPSAKLSTQMGIMNPFYGGANGDWFEATRVAADQGIMTCYGMVCRATFPPGWGGAITDSYNQQTCAYSGRAGGEAGGPFEMTIGHTINAYNMKTAQIQDPSRYLVVADVGVHYRFWDSSLVAYPDMCRLRCAACDWGPNANWTDCPWTVDCGAGDARLGYDDQYRKQFAGGRHLGGTNLGFADGHASWMSAEAILFGAEDWRWQIPAEQKNPRPAIIGIGVCGDYTPQSP